MALGFSVIKDETLPDGMRGFTLKRQSDLYFQPAYKPREEISISHELAHHFEHPSVRPEAIERWCTRVGAALVLPRTEFLESLFLNKLSIPAMRRQWRLASWELLVLRVVDLLPGTGAAAWVDDGLKWRTDRHSRPLLAAETAAVRDAKRHGSGLVLAGGWLAAAWSLTPKGASFRAVSLCLPMPR